MNTVNTAEAIPPTELTPITVLPSGIRKRTPRAAQRFKVLEFVNRAGSLSWRVSGVKRDDGRTLAERRVRENFKDEASARCRQIELETEHLQGHTDTAIQATRLNQDQLRLAEAALLQLGEDWPRIVDAVELWKSSRQQRATTAAPRIDDAVKQFVDWLDLPPPHCDLAGHTRSGYRLRAKMFSKGVENVRVADITPKFIASYLSSRQSSQVAVSQTTVKNDRRAICRFLSWCVEKEWIVVNPAIGRPQKKTGGKRNGKLPEIFTVNQCGALLRAAENHNGGMLVPYVAVCLFAGLRPDSEAERITWKQINLRDKQITITPEMTKTGIPRTISISPTLAKWLKAYDGVEFYPSGWRKNFDKVKRAAGIDTWIVDGMRHTAHSHYFRSCGSYGLTAEFFGNSEEIVRRNYVNRVDSAEMKKFYDLAPKGRGRK